MNIKVTLDFDVAVPPCERCQGQQFSSSHILAYEDEPFSVVVVCQQCSYEVVLPLDPPVSMRVDEDQGRTGKGVPAHPKVVPARVCQHTPRPTTQEGAA